MADDVARLPATGITPVVCGDSHLGNFGFYASPERELVIDLNDFDEAHPGLLGVGSAPAGRQRLGGRAGRTARPRTSARPRCWPASRPTARRSRFLAEQPLLTRSYNRLDVDRLHETTTEKSLRDGDRALGQAGPDPDQRPGAAAVHRASTRAGGGSSRSRR